MKFHLPKTLFVAVMAAVVATSQAYAVADKYNFQEYDNVTIVNSEGAVTITVTDMKEGKTMSE